MISQEVLEHLLTQATYAQGFHLLEVTNQETSEIMRNNMVREDRWRQLRGQTLLTTKTMETKKKKNFSGADGAHLQ